MAEVRLATTPAAGLRRLGVHGQQVVAMHRQLTAILGNRLGRQHALLFARPNISPGDDSIEWYAGKAGPAQALADLPVADRQPLETLHRQLLAEIGQLAQKMKREGGSAELAGHMLDLATVTPRGAPVWVVAGQPVLVLWGHADEAQAVPDAPAVMPPPASAVSPASVSPASVPPARVPPASVPAAGAPGMAVPPAAAATEAASASAAGASGGASSGANRPAAAALGAPPARGGWLPWLLPLLLLLLLAWLAWRAMQPLAPVVVERPSPAPPAAADPLAPEQERERTLREEIARLTALRDEQLAQCKPLPPPEPVAPPPQVTEAPPKPEPPKPEPPKKEPPKVQAKPKPEPKQPVKPEEPKVAVVPPVPPQPAPSRKDCPLEYPPGKNPQVVVVVDASGSMRERISGGTSRMQAAKDAVEQVVGGLAPPVELGLIDFSDCNTINNQGRYSYEQRPSMIGQVRSLSPQRGTPLARSIQRAGNMMTSRPGREGTIVVITDGDDTCPGSGDPCAMARQVRQQKPNVTINVIDVSGGAGTATAKCIASAGGGIVLTPGSAADMKTKMQQATRLPDTRTCKP
jgi:hypothetical protein